MFVDSEVKEFVHDLFQDIRFDVGAWDMSIITRGTEARFQALREESNKAVTNKRYREKVKKDYVRLANKKAAQKRYREKMKNDPQRLANRRLKKMESKRRQRSL